jgi:3-isopropylmalate/(R)-2-methylmalate dehydratase small subunit
VISTSIADICFSNALKNGLVPVRIDAPSHAWLVANPGAEVEVDVEASCVRLPGGREAPFAIDPFARHCLLNGVDELGYLLSRLPAIEAWENEGDSPLQSGH